MSTRRKRRSWSDEENREICAQAVLPGASVAQVARRYSANANMIHNWLKDPRFARIPADPVIIPENHWVENWTSPAFDALGERHEEIKIYGKPDPGDFEAG
ncbi:transposase [Roseibium marinum]|uniref:transposase n=1 Tax=Roseibium marinum TaxID=281252 RepID=UPI0011AF80F7|nr:transposase [Roseibium marinum]